MYECACVDRAVYVSIPKPDLHTQESWEEPRKTWDVDANHVVLRVPFQNLEDANLQKELVDFRCGLFLSIAYSERVEEVEIVEPMRRSHHCNTIVTPR
jgi:hypothetical protein